MDVKSFDFFPSKRVVLVREALCLFVLYIYSYIRVADSAIYSAVYILLLVL